MTFASHSWLQTVASTWGGGVTKVTLADLQAEYPRALVREKDLSWYWQGYIGNLTRVCPMLLWLGVSQLRPVEFPFYLTFQIYLFSNKV